MSRKSLRVMRLEKGWSLRAMADEINQRYPDAKASYAQLSKIERGVVKSPHPPLRAALCDLYDLPITYFDDR